MTPTTRFITEIEVICPISKLPVSLSIFVDKNTGGVFGVDTSYIQSIIDNEVSDVLIPSMFGGEQPMMVLDVDGD